MERDGGFRNGGLERAKEEGERESERERGKRKEKGLGKRFWDGKTRG